GLRLRMGRIAREDLRVGDDQIGRGPGLEERSGRQSQAREEEKNWRAGPHSGRLTRISAGTAASRRPGTATVPTAPAPAPPPSSRPGRSAALRVVALASR